MGIQGRRCAHYSLFLFFLLLTFSCRYLTPSNEAYLPHCLCYCPPPPLRLSNMRRRGFLATPHHHLTPREAINTTAPPSLEHKTEGIVAHHYPSKRKWDNKSQGPAVRGTPPISPSASASASRSPSTPDPPSLPTRFPLVPCWRAT